MPALATAARMGFMAALAAGCALPPVDAMVSPALPMATATPPAVTLAAPAPSKAPTPTPGASPGPHAWSGPGFAFRTRDAWRQVGEDEGDWRIITFWRRRDGGARYVPPPLVLALEGTFGPFHPRLEVRKGPPGGRAELAADAARLADRFGNPTEATLGGAPSLRFRMQEESPHEVFTHFGYEVVERGGASWHLWWGTATNAELWPDHAEHEKAILAAIEAIRTSWTWKD